MDGKDLLNVGEAAASMEDWHYLMRGYSTPHSRTRRNAVSGAVVRGSQTMGLKVSVGYVLCDTNQGWGRPVLYEYTTNQPKFQ